MGQAVHVDLVGSLLGLPSHVHSLLGGDELDQLVAVLAHNDGPAGGRIRNIEAGRAALPEVTGHVVPGHAVAVLVVQHGQAGLVVELLQALDGDADVVLGVDGALLDPLVVIRLRFSLPARGPVRVSTFQPDSNLLSSPAPERLAWSRPVSRSDPVVVRSGPEPAVDIDGREVGRVTTLVLEIAFSATCVDGGHVIWKRFLSVNDWDWSLSSRSVFTF